MTILSGVVLGPISSSVLAICLIFASIIALALLKKKRVKAVVWLRSFGFFIEADNDRQRD